MTDDAEPFSDGHSWMVIAPSQPLRVWPPRRRTNANRPSGRFINRELSWIDFNRRVLELASDQALPVFDRVQYCGIASSNLDEFFAVRMAELHDQVVEGVVGNAPDGRTPSETLADARYAIIRFQALQDRVWLHELRPALASHGLRICRPDECRPRELHNLTRRFERDVLGRLNPIAAGPESFRHLPSLALNVAALVPDAGELRLVCIGLPHDASRFLSVGSDGRFVSAEQAIIHFLASVVGSNSVMHGVFRVTRDADMALVADADDLLEALETGLRSRRFGDVVRLEVGAEMPPALRHVIMRALELEPEQFYESKAPLGLGEFSELAAYGRGNLKRVPWQPVTAPEFQSRSPTAILAQIRASDLLAHHPYDAYDSSVERFVAASTDEKVATLKATIYRTGNPSRTVDSLVDAAGKGKDAACLVELRARFDERRNIEWSRALDRAGVRVFYGSPDLKVHAKLCLIVLREGAGFRRYAHVGTGNYHASNASAYEDLSLFTADDDITADVADLFDAVTARRTPSPFRKLLVAPWFLRQGLLDHIERVTRAAEMGQSARIRLKVNALVDPEIVEALYAASRAGAVIEAITRGMCVLRPGVRRLSERITVKSVLGPFLEHSRILAFEVGDDHSIWIGSADLMPRNLDRRVEVLAPVEDARLRARIMKILDALLGDTRFAWQLDPKGVWHRVRPPCGEQPRSAQEVLMVETLERLS